VFDVLIGNAKEPKEKQFPIKKELVIEPPMQNGLIKKLIS
jgi:hypothetical protein